MAWAGCSGSPTRPPPSGGWGGPPAAGALIDATGGYRWAVAAAMAVGLLAFAVTLLLNRPGTTDPWPD